VPAPGAGAAAALTAGFAAALATMAARAADDQDADELEGLVERVAELAQADADAYREVLASTGEARREALTHAAEVPLTVGETAATVAAAAARLAEEGNPNLRGEALTAALLAAAAARAAAALVALNAGEESPQAERGRARAHAAEAAARRALESS
jgi:formiminotetrahydrofolate cyclodeaminase